jgi:hypothetical protein
MVILLLILIPAGFFGVLGLVVLVLKLVAVVQKAAEPPTRDDGYYDLDQGQDVGKQE